MNKQQKLGALEKLARDRTVKGWAFMNISAERRAEIIAFLDGGPCPEHDRKMYALCRKQLKLPEIQEEENHGNEIRPDLD